ncbi:phage holin family protein [Pistricoccus aurantiacus]|uniref:phage holin family protein n=1 Tax=Pistricoccus aurantiacus TaxID=1883414 RepID=UPI0036306864
MDSENTPNKDRSTFTGLLSDLTNELTSLVRQEIELAKAEVSEKISQTTSGATSVAIAGAVLFAGFLVLLAAAVFGLNTVLPPDTTPWLSALIVGVIVVVVGFIMLQSGRKKLKAQNLAPQRTLSSLKSDKQLAQKHERNTKEALK